MGEKRPNAKLAALITQADVSKEGLARRVAELASQAGMTVAYDHVSVSRWLRGSQPKPEIRELIALALARKLGRPVSLADIGMEPTGGAPIPEPALVDAADDGVASALSLMGADLAGSVTAALPGVSAQAWSDLMVRWLVTPAQAGSIDPREIAPANPAEAIRYTTDTFAQLDYRFGGGHARQSFMAYFQSTVAPMVRTVNPATDVGRAVLDEAAALLRLIAWTSYDSGLHGAAQRYFSQALSLAKSAGNRALGGRILAGMSHQANFLGHFEHAVNLARAAVTGARGYATPTGMALFHSMEARGLASLGKEAECLAALREAEAWFAQRNAENDPYWLQYFDDAELAAEYAHCFRDLGQPALSAEFADRAMSLHGSQYVRSMTFVRTVLATSHISQGELEQGLELAHDVLEVARGSGLQSVRTVSYIRDFLTRLEPYRREQRVEGFHQDALETLSRAGA